MTAPRSTDPDARECCETCRFVHRGWLNYRCRRLPPVTQTNFAVFVLPFMDIAKFPCVRAHDWCGEYQPSDGEA